MKDSITYKHEINTNATKLIFNTAFILILYFIDPENLSKTPQTIE